jgi:hypothetical protein
LYRDRYGREYICENGRRVYVNSQQGQPYGAAYRGMDGQQFQGDPGGDQGHVQGDQGNLTPTPAIPTDPNAASGAPAGQTFPQAQTGAAATGSAAAGSGNSGALPGEAPRDINQSQTHPETGGIIEPGDSAR